MFKHILVPTDGSKLSQETAKRAVSFAKEAGAKITALFIKQEVSELYWNKSAWGHLPKPAKLEESAEQEAQEILGGVEKLCLEAGVSCTKLSQYSVHVYEGIISAAAECGCDLIFMASHGRRGVDALVLGSETNKVLTHTKIPVLVYR